MKQSHGEHNLPTQFLVFRKNPAIFNLKLLFLHLAEWSASDHTQRHGDGDSISRGVGGLDDNSVDGDSVSGSVGSLEQCI